MPFDTALPTDAVQFAAPAASSDAFARTAAPDPDWALANPERALAFLMVAPQPCEALDALLGLRAA